MSAVALVERSARRADAVVLAVALALAVGLKAAFSGAAAEAYLWLLAPTTALVGWLTGLGFAWEGGVGYVNAPLRYTIAPVCAGLTFFVAALGALATLLATGRGTWGARARWLLASVGLAFVATVAANATRLVLALTLRQDQLRLPGLDAAEAHRLLGIVVYLVALVGLVALARRQPTQGTLRAPLLVGLGWYVGVALVIPALRGQTPAQALLVHAAWVLGGVGALLGLAALSAGVRSVRCAGSGGR